MKIFLYIESPLYWISNQSILKEIHPECSLEGLMLKLKQQYFGHLRRRVYSLENTLIVGKIECRKRRGWQRMEIDGWHHWLNEHEFKQLWDREGQGSLGMLQSMGSQRIEHESHWTNWFISILNKKQKAECRLILFKIFQW